MLGLSLSVVVTAWVGYMLYKRYKPQGVLLAAGIALMVCAVVFGSGTILPAKQATGFIWFDIFEAVKKMMSDRLAGLGLTIMSIGGFVRYMEQCGANKALVEVSAYPLKLVRSPMIVMMVAYMIGQVVDVFIPSHAGLGLLLMLTLYPIMVKAGLSKLTAVAIIATAKFTDIGPISSNAILAAHTAGLDPVTYFIKYQLPVVIPSIIVVGIAHYFIQPWWDRREGYSVDASNNAVEEAAATEKIPRVYAILPTLPLILVIVFCPLFVKSVKMDVITAMLICTIVAMIFEFIRLRDIRPVMDNIMTFFDGMGKQFVVVVSLIICAETFAMGLVKIGAVDALIQGAQSAGFGLKSMVLIISMIMVACSFIMGSGNASFFAFAGLAPKIAAYLKVDPVLILLPMEITAGFGRCISPITPAIVAISSIADVSPFQVAKRCAIPVIIGLIANMVTTYIIFL
ncbi:C4-dicarboxylate transporter DcuC [Pelosinus propionicus]|uniref:C4-dicarboxylate transporter, DcuC family n=1 Tax=Pelosinus propionicus DSM 13327 TaxID=1123291 RepID=A0A1I4ICI7_9FIRM|nr:C4-dicarboxylate transporter DcuC [Pelosinus propionicus]SFL52118.1 C4-dicarboxylate transporter, DcuC family [Pelosinus propionicus DSM 13327]